MVIAFCVLQQANSRVLKCFHSWSHARRSMAQHAPPTQTITPASSPQQSPGNALIRGYNGDNGAGSLLSQLAGNPFFTAVRWLHPID